jgi:hypothetical protein
MMRRFILGAIIAGLMNSAIANDVEIVKVRLSKSGDSWRANVTLLHGDTGWDHYADAWRIVDPDGAVLGTRVLYHPHVDEQPFTRSLGRIDIPDTLPKVFVEAHDKVHGWSKQRIEIDMNKSSGERYEIVR